jgi:hypothetical protein
VADWNTVDRSISIFGKYISAYWLFFGLVVTKTSNPGSFNTGEAAAAAALFLLLNIRHRYNVRRVPYSCRNSPREYRRAKGSNRERSNPDMLTVSPGAKRLSAQSRDVSEPSSGVRNVATNSSTDGSEAV